MWLRLEPDALDKAIAEMEAKGCEPSTIKPLQSARAQYARDDDDLTLIAAAKEHKHRDGEIEIDDDAAVSRGSDPGAYVMAWVWVYYSEAGMEDEPDDETDDALEDATTKEG